MKIIKNENQQNRNRGIIKNMKADLVITNKMLMISEWPSQMQCYQRAKDHKRKIIQKIKENM